MIVSFKNQATEDIFNGVFSQSARKIALKTYGVLQVENLIKLTLSQHLKS
jgi:hypothetical protein